MSTAKFQYKARKSEDWEKREKQSGSSFVGFIEDQFETYTVRKGENWMRILPPTWEDPSHYGYDVWVHYGVGPQNASVICLLKQKNQPCPICEAKAIAEDAGKDDLASELKPGRRVCVWILDRKEEKKPQIWAMPWSLDRDISKVARDRQTGELYQLDHPDAGYDVSFDAEGEAMTRKYVGTQLARRPSPVDEKHLDYIMANPLPNCLIWRNYAELKELLAGVPSAAVAGEATRTATPAVERPARMSPGEEARWEAEQAAKQNSSEISSVAQRAVTERPITRAAVVADPVQTVERENPTQSAPETSSAGARVADSRPADQPVAQTTTEAQPAKTLSRAEALRARFGK